jgi:UDP-3-O-[3-hydroxymyristoyl] glucosamine N-acyltransferase
MGTDKRYRLSEICREIEVEYDGPDIEIDGIDTLGGAVSGKLSFFNSQKYASDLSSTRASAVLLEEKYRSMLPDGVIALVTDEPYLKLALATSFFAHEISAREYSPSTGEGCDISSTARFGEGVELGDGVVVMAGAYIGDGCRIGDGSIIHPNVTIYHHCRLGDRCIVHSGTVIGSDGYGFAHTADGRHIKIHQLGAVVVGDDVEIGSNTTIDRGALGDTLIGDGCKIDNLVQIGHNCELGENCLIVSQTGLSGSTRLGRNVVFGGQSASAGHLAVGDFATVAARGGVTKSLEGGAVYAGFPATDIASWRREKAIIRKMSHKKR